MKRTKKINGKKLLNDYISLMDKAYKEQKELQEAYNNDNIIDEYFNYDKSVRITRMWEIIMSMEDIASRNLLLLFHACGCRYKETFMALSGLDVEYKNEATLRVMCCRARSQVREIYKNKYNNCK